MSELMIRVRSFESSQVGLRMVFRTMVLVLLACCLATDPAQAKGLELTGFGGVILGGRVGTREGDINIIDGASYGFALNIGLQRSPQSGVQVELYYKRQDSRLELETWPEGRTADLFDMSVEYFHVGVLRKLRAGRVSPYIIGSLGSTRLNPKVRGSDDEWIFSVGAGGGVKAMSESGRVGFRLDVRFLAPLYFAGGSVFCSSGGGCSTGVAAGTVFAQLDISGGIIIAF